MLDLDPNDPEIVQARRIRLLGPRLFRRGVVKAEREKDIDLPTLAMYRLAVGFTQKDVATFCRVSLATVKSWEAGRSTPLEAVMDKLTWIKIQARRNPAPPAERLTAAAVRTIRKRSGFTQSSFAVLLGVTVGTVTRWESGTCAPSPEHTRELLALQTLAEETAEP